MMTQHQIVPRVRHLVMAERKKQRYWTDLDKQLPQFGVFDKDNNEVVCEVKCDIDFQIVFG